MARTRQSTREQSRAAVHQAGNDSRVVRSAQDRSRLAWMQVSANQAKIHEMLDSIFDESQAQLETFQQELSTKSTEGEENESRVELLGAREEELEATILAHQNEFDLLQEEKSELEDHNLELRERLDLQDQEIEALKRKLAQEKAKNFRHARRLADLNEKCFRVAEYMRGESANLEASESETVKD
ncbi:hypothetical protein PMIN06_001789 [Paraphaeosphaeria minitans]